LAGLALGGIHLRFALQTRHLVTSTFVSRGRRGTWGTGLALVARLGALETFAWEPVRGNIAWEPLGNLACLFLGTLLGNLASSWEPCVGILLGNLAWEPVPGNVVGKLLLGIFAWEPVPGNVAWEPVPGNLAWEPLPGNLAWEPLGNLAWSLPAFLGTCLGTLGSADLGCSDLLRDLFALLGKNISPSRRNTIYT